MYRPGSVVTFESAAVDRMLPMHLRFDTSGIVRHVAPGMAKLAGERTLKDRPLLECFEITRPRGISSAWELRKLEPPRVKLRFREGRPVRLRGMALALGDGEGGVLSLALDLSELRDLGGAALTTADFSPTDMTVDMLYLMEANSAAMAETRRLISRLDGAKTVAEAQAFTDTLTGLANRRALERIVNRLVTSGDAFSLCNIDLDYFKSVNDSYGHAAGDHVLQVVAAALRSATRASDTVARVGGDEFILVLPGMTDPDRIEEIAVRIISELQRPVLFEGHSCRISASVGTAISTCYRSPDLDQMVVDADRALYASKAAGRSRHSISGGECGQAASRVVAPGE
ncbi:diguanylate cyclase domain-containing protein [Palleronia sp. LCG004]|uniref:diguanylate cyclase domain-containing protein n=1 Tax=Palleronia sp. LCG004 TaxID=3079304 RepID=UPI002943C269|nr:diguanylate cyclase [Palleronia sp. LCG004]WOI55050.1 diguanylate cyclase [Palleronia sp. LCG004]